MTIYTGTDGKMMELGISKWNKWKKRRDKLCNENDLDKLATREQFEILKGLIESTNEKLDCMKEDLDKIREDVDTIARDLGLTKNPEGQLVIPKDRFAKG